MAMNKNRVIDCLIGLSVAGMLVFVFRILPSIGAEAHSGGSSSESDIIQIARSYVAHGNLGRNGFQNLPVKPGDSVHAAAFYLALFEGLNDASMYFVKGDPLSPATIPLRVLEGDPEHPRGLNADFSQATLSVVMAANFPDGVRTATTPVAWTRGLQANGTWSSDSPYKDAGGHIAFLDGHVAWYDRIYTNPTQGPTLTKYGTNETTTDIREALPPGAIILGAEPRPFVPENSTANPPGP
jgi:prepilin-type processing-associated H-X9-DG protein